MSNQPQCPIEEIELIPHPMDAWRAALNALIACAPGDGPAIAAHLAEAGEQALVYVNRTGATPGVAKMVDRLMLIGAGRIVGERLQRGATRVNDGNAELFNALGFTHHAPSIGIDLSAAAVRARQSTGQPGAASSGVHAAQNQPLSNAPTTASAQAPQDPAAPGLLAPQLCEARREPGRESAPRSAADESLQRPSGDFSSQ